MTRLRRHPRRRAAQQRGYVLIGVVLTLMMAAAIAYQIGRESVQNVTSAASEEQALQARYVAEAGLALAAARLNAAGTCAAIAAGAPVTGQIGSDTFSVTSTTLASNPLTLVLTSTPTLGATGTTFAPLSRTVVVYTLAEQQTTVFRAVPGTGTVADTSIAHKITGIINGHTVNLGAEVRLGVDNSDKVMNALLRFDLAGAVPSGAKLKSAQLVLTSVSPWANPGDTADLTVHEVTRSWVEGTGTYAAPATITSGATWDQPQSGVAAWGFVPYLSPSGVNDVNNGSITTGGGDYDPAYVARVYVDSGAIAASYSWDVTPLAAQWLATPALNFGLLVKGEEQLRQALFASSEAADRSARPKLVLTTLLPCGGPSVRLSTVDVTTGQPVLVATLNTPVRLRIELLNGASASAALSSALSVALPAGVSVANPAGASVSGCSGMVFAPAAGATALTLSGGSVPAASGTAPGVCTATVSVSGSVASGSATLVTGPTGTATTFSVAAGALATSRGSNVAPASAALYVVPLPTLVSDSSINETNKDNNYGTQTWLQLRNNNPVRALVRFTGLPPAGVPVQSATLRLYLRNIVNPGSTTSFSIEPYVLTRSWSETSVDWKDPWGNDGGDLTLNPSMPRRTFATLSPASWLAFDVALAANAWGGGAANHGLVLISWASAPNGQDDLFLDSREYPGGNPPQLQITY